MPIPLDDASGLAHIDASNMLGQMAALPDQLFASLSGEVDIDKGVRKLCLCGLGGSAMGADILCDHLEGTTNVFASVVRDVRLPGWVDEDTLTVLFSYSGNTRETLAMYEEARRRGSQYRRYHLRGKIAADMRGQRRERCTGPIRPPAPGRPRPPSGKCRDDLGRCQRSPRGHRAQEDGPILARGASAPAPH